jgi:hypothetical protein
MLLVKQETPEDFQKHPEGECLFLFLFQVKENTA